MFYFIVVKEPVRFQTHVQMMLRCKPDLTYNLSSEGKLENVPALNSSISFLLRYLKSKIE